MSVFSLTLLLLQQWSDNIEVFLPQPIDDALKAAEVVTLDDSHILHGLIILLNYFLHWFFTVFQNTILLPNDFSAAAEHKYLVVLFQEESVGKYLEKSI